MRNDDFFDGDGLKINLIIVGVIINFLLFEEIAKTSNFT